MINLLPHPQPRVIPVPPLAPGEFPAEESPARSALRLLTEHFLWRDAEGLDPGPIDRGRLREMQREAVQVGIVFSDWAGLPE